MIQIDDAGWGSLIGGVVIGVYRTTTGEFAHGIVAPCFFQGEAYVKKGYLDEAARQAEVCFERLRVRPDERVEICTGYVLNGVREWLSGAGYNWRPAKIEGSLQELVERAFWEHLGELGFRVSYDNLYADSTKRGLLWWRQIQWLKGGNVDATEPVPERAAVCKTGWASFDVWATHLYKEARQLARRLEEQRRRGWMSRCIVLWYYCH